MNRAVLLILTVLFCSCGKNGPSQQANQPETNPHNQPSAKLKVEPAEATLTPGMETAKKTHNEGRYQDAVRFYTAELAAEEAKPAPSWVQLSHLNNQLGRALDNFGQYDHALEYYQKALPIWLKKLGADHSHVAASYNNIGEVHRAKGEYDHALEYYQKALAIFLKKLGPDHSLAVTSYNNMALVYFANEDLPKAKEYWEKASMPPC